MIRTSIQSDSRFSGSLSSQKPACYRLPIRGSDLSRKKTTKAYRTGWLAIASLLIASAAAGASFARRLTCADQITGALTFVSSVPRSSFVLTTIANKTKPIRFGNLRGDVYELSLKMERDILSVYVKVVSSRSGNKPKHAMTLRPELGAPPFFVYYGTGLRQLGLHNLFKNVEAVLLQGTKFCLILLNGETAWGTFQRNAEGFAFHIQQGGAQVQFNKNLGNPPEPLGGMYNFRWPYHPRWRWTAQ